MQLQTVLCYSYTYMVFITKFLKSKVNYIQPQYQLSPVKYFWCTAGILRYTDVFLYRRAYATWNMVQMELGESHENRSRFHVTFKFYNKFLFGAN
jgi:hypothetical protein